MQKSSQSNSAKSLDQEHLQQQSQPILKKQQSEVPQNSKNKKKLLPSSNLLANLSDTKYPVVKQVMKKMLNIRITKDPTIMDWDIMWTDNAVTPDQLAKMKFHQKINHFPGMFTLSRKNYLARNLRKMSKVFPEEYNFFPKTWILPSEYSQLKSCMESEANLIVIAKPEASSQGKGIFLSKDIQDFEFGQHYVVQKYLKKPYLIDNLKFDLRIYVLIAGCDPLRIYVYRQGLARFATQNYQLPKKDNLDNLFMHLTNYSINKNSEKFQFNQSHTEMDKGHKRSLTSIANYLGQQWTQIWKKIKDLIAKTIISTQPILAHHYRSCQPQNYANNMCFQILGFDVILDNVLQPYILEVNYTPSFTTDTPLDKLIKQSLIRDSLILMNLTNKAKNDSVNLKKKQMVQRTLTGKKVRYTKEQRQKIINKYQKKRDTWQNANLGNFDKVLPDKNTQQYDKMLQFINVSQQLYENITGANIRRNNKIIPANIPQSENNETKQPLKLTNTEQLQKIYKAGMKPMKIGKKKQSILQKTQTAPVPSFKSVPRKPTQSSQVATKTITNNIYNAKARPTSAIKKAVCSNIYNISFKS